MLDIKKFIFIKTIFFVLVTLFIRMEIAKIKPTNYV